MRRAILVSFGLVLAASLTPAAWAVAFASGVTDLGGGNYSFVLNHDASNVVIERIGGTSLNLGALPAGTHNFSLDGATGYNIRVSSSAAVGWSQYVADGMDRSFWSPLGVSIDKNPASPSFGRVYVSNASAGTTGFGRPCLDGIYMLNAAGVDTGFTTAGVDWTGGSAPFKSTVGPDGHLYVAHYSNDLVYEISADMTSATQLIDATNKTADQFVCSIHVEGTQAAGNRKIYLVDSNYYTGLPGRKGLIQYDLAGNPTATPGDTGVQYIGPDYFAFYPMDVARDSNGDWYMNQYRYASTEAPAISKFLDGAPPINTAAWEASQDAQFNGSYGIDVYEPEGWVAFGNYYDGWVHIFDMDDGSYIGGFDAGTRVREVAFDAAGNIVTVDNSVEWARFWSPGGDFLTILGSDGTFLRIPEPAGLALLALGALFLRRR